MRLAGRRVVSIYIKRCVCGWVGVSGCNGFLKIGNIGAIIVHLMLMLIRLGYSNYKVLKCLFVCLFVIKNPEFPEAKKSIIQKYQNL